MARLWLLQLRFVGSIHSVHRATFGKGGIYFSVEPSNDALPKELQLGSINISELERRTLLRCWMLGLRPYEDDRTATRKPSSEEEHNS